MSLEKLDASQLADDGAATMHRLIEQRDVHRVIIEALPQTTLAFSREAKATGVRVSLLPRILEVVGSTIEVDDVDDVTLLGLRRFGLSRSSKVIKRSFDATGAAVGLLVLSPFLLVVALLIKRDAPERSSFVRPNSRRASVRRSPHAAPRCTPTCCSRATCPSACAARCGPSR